MKIVKLFMGGVFVVALAACGGGGGSAGFDPGKDPVVVTDPVIVSQDPVLRSTLQDVNGNTTNSISASGLTVLNVTLTDPSGRGIPNQVVSVTGDETKVVFPEGSGGLTNASGVASIKVARASLFATGADSLAVTYSYKAGSLTTYPDGSIPPTVDKVVARYVGYQLSASNISLTNLNLGQSTLAAYGTRQVSVQANIDGSAATSTPVQVSFSANCGSVTPATASTNSQGLVQVSYSAANAADTNDQGCSGTTVSIVASTTGAKPVADNLEVDLAPATNLLFVDALPATIFLAGSGGATQSVVKFRLVNASNSPIRGQNILLELGDLAGGIPKTSIDTVGSTVAVTKTTDFSGQVSVPVFSGTVPTNVTVKASLVSNPAITTTSAVLAIASGRPVQSRASLSVDKLSIEGGNINGEETQVTMYLADRQGNPVPDGTAVNFISESGVMIPPVCRTLNSRCSSVLSSGEKRKADGLVSILAYAAGEEDFRDLNGDNSYTQGELFTDLGNAFRDDAALVGGVTGTYQDGYYSHPRAGEVACVNEIPEFPSFLGRPNSCDGVWGAADVRQQAVVVFATSRANITVSSMVATTPIARSNPVTNGLSDISVVISDQNGNSMPTGTKVEFDTVDDGASVPGLLDANCRLNSSSSYVIDNTILPSVFPAALSFCTAGDKFQVKVTSPLGTVTERLFNIVN